MYVHCWACVLFYALSSFYVRIACSESYIDKTMACCVRARVLLCVCAYVRAGLHSFSFSVLPITSSNHSHLYFLFFSIYQLFTELRSLSSRYGWNLLFFSSYTSHVTSARSHRILSTAAFVCSSAHSCACETRTEAALLDPHGREP